MEYILIIIAAVVIALIITFFIFSRRKASHDNDTITNVETSVHAASGALATVSSNEISIPIIQLPATMDFGNKSLFEITDLTVIARISETIPNAAQTVAKTITSNAQKSVELFRLDIPSAALTKSKDVEGALRAFSRGKTQINKNANLMIVDPTQLTKASAVANSVANVMNVASLIVGQYYMSEINAKLDAMSNTVNKISDFQDSEFKSRILSLVARVGKISQFSSEILENDEQRNLKLAALEDLEGNTTELLGQVNLTISDIVKKSPNPDYKTYQARVDDFTILVEYQNALVVVLEEISKLTYLLGRGCMSSEMCYSIYEKFLDQSFQARSGLEEWHDQQVTALQIDLDKNRKSKSGVEGFFASITAFIIDDKWKYKELKVGLASKISTQTQTTLKSVNGPRAVYDENVQIIIKDGKYFYLAGEANEHN